MNNHELHNDAEVARQRKLRIYVARKEAWGMPWVHIHENVADLEQAVRMAQSMQAYESGVFVSHPQLYNGGSLYWTSRRPDLLNNWWNHDGI